MQPPHTTLDEVKNRRSVGGEGALINGVLEMVSINRLINFRLRLIFKRLVEQLID